MDDQAAIGMMDGLGVNGVRSQRPSKRRAACAASSIAMLISLGVASPALAQQAPAAEAEMADQEIIVTAQRREERLRDIPLSVSALSGEALERRDISDADALSFAVPGLGAYQIGPGQTLLQIRGISTFRGSASLIGAYLDEAPLTGGVRAAQGSALNVQAYDLARVEVLKGPQGTLFGEGAIGGVIRYITNDPVLDRIEGNASVSLSDTYRGDPSTQFTGVLNLPIAQDVAGIRIAARHEREGGWIENLTSGESNYNDSTITDIRVRGLFKPAPDLSIRTLVNIHRLDADGTNIVNRPPFSRSQFRQAFNSADSTRQTNDFEIYNLTVQYDLGVANLLSSSSHFNTRQRPNGYQTQVVLEPSPGFGALEVLAGRRTSKQKVWSQEFRLTSSTGGAFNWIVGGNYKLTRTRSGSPTDDGDDYLLLFPGIDPIVILNDSAGISTRTRSEIYTAFADVSYKIVDRLEVGGGVRGFWEKRTQHQFSPALAPISNLSANFDKLTYRLFARLQLNDNINLYANTATGFRSGEINMANAIAAGAPGSAGPEQSRFYEAGIKSSFLDGRLAVDVSAYRGTFDDQIQNLFRTPISFFANVGKARIQGIDWAVNVRPARGLVVSFSGDVTDTKFLRVSNLSDVSVGDPIDFVPDYSLLVSADYNFRWSADVEGYLNVSSSWKGPMQATNRFNGLGIMIDKTDTLNFTQATLGARVGRFDVSVFARNITNERGRLFPQFSGIWTQARPRSFGMALGASF